ncbi:MAG: hypothetical protein ACODAE_00310 [Gemmatimonadota bacterium]
MRPISPRHVLAVLLTGVVVLASASLAGQVSRFFLGHDYVKGLVPLFFVDEEANVPTWYASMLLFTCSLLLASIAVRRRRTGDPFARHWTALAVGFLVMSIDEAAAMHELLNGPLREAFALDGAFYYSWVVAGIALAAVVGVAYLPFLAQLPARWRRLFVVAGALYLGGSLGMEMVGSARADAHGVADFTYTMLALGEETLEMLGASLFIYALLTYIAAMWGGFRVTLAIGGVEAGRADGVAGAPPHPAPGSATGDRSARGAGGAAC